MDNVYVVIEQIDGDINTINVYKNFDDAKKAFVEICDSPETDLTNKTMFVPENGVLISIHGCTIK